VPVDIGDYDKRTALHISAAEGNAVMVSTHYSALQAPALLKTTLLISGSIPRVFLCQKLRTHSALTHKLLNTQCHWAQQQLAACATLLCMK
jgi:hypothetical protein